MGAKALPAPPPAGCLPCTLYWTYVSLSLCDTSLWYVSVSKSSIFRTLFSRLFKLYTVVYISCCRSVLFYIDHRNQESLLQWKKQQSRRQSPQSRGVGAVWKYIFFFQNLAAYYTSLLGLSCCIQMSIFRGIVQSYLTLITWVKNLCFSERKSKAGESFYNHVELALSGNILFSEALCILHQSTGSELLYTVAYIFWQRSFLSYIDHPSQESLL